MIIAIIYKAFFPFKNIKSLSLDDHKKEHLMQINILPQNKELPFPPAVCKAVTRRMFFRQSAYFLKLANIKTRTFLPSRW